MDDDDGFRTQRPLSDKPLQTLARDNLALLVPIVGALIFVFRCIIVSSGDLYVAFILITESSIGDAIRALLFTVLPSLLYISSFVAAAIVATRIFDRNLHTPGTLVTLGIVMSVALALGSLYLSGLFDDGAFAVVLFSTAPLILTMILMATRARARRSPSESGGIFPYVAAVFIVVIVSSVLPLAEDFSDRAFWLPRERLDFQNEAPFTGYVLKVSEDHLVILNDKPRIIIEKPKSALEDRDFCYPKDHRARSSNVKSDAPTCP